MRAKVIRQAAIVLTTAVALALWAFAQVDPAKVVGGLLLLVIGAEWLVTGAVALARAMGVSPLVIGLTVVAFGTSAPELAASVRASLAGNGALAVGNVVGSNIANVCLILGFTALLRPVPVESGIVRKDVPIMLVVTALAMLAFLGGRVERWEGALMILGIIVFTVLMFIGGKKEASLRTPDSIEEDKPRPTIRRKSIAIRIVLGLVTLVFGAELLVGGAKGLASAMGVSSTVIGLSVVAFGTSLPELVTSITATFKREADLAVGNILGSNVFNLFCVLGAASLVRGLDVPPETLTRDAWMMLIVSAACLPILGTSHRISRFEGALLFVTYLVYMVVIYIA